ncbi:MAG: MFS transporter [Nitrospinota bacterium]|jgi:MFS family permease|nr:MFS transporter [Nitrospinota bacterium]MDP6618960.1 MFS transporter [Nitrospinota bacterium]
MKNRWVIVFAAAVITMVGFGSRGVFGVFYVEMLREFEWDRADLAGVYSVGMLIMGGGGALAGALSRLLGPRRFYLLAGLLLGLTFCLASRVGSLLDVYLTWGVLGGLSLAGLGLAPTQGLVARWFATRRGLAIGLVGAGTGGGNLIFAPLAQIFIESYGWRSGLVVLGVISFIVVAVVGAVFMREPPHEAVRESRPKLEAGPPSGGSSAAEASAEWTLRSALRTSPIWTISLAWLCLATPIHFIGTHFVALVVGVGHPALFGSGILALGGALSIVNRVIGGGLSDRIGRVKTFVGGGCMAALGLAVLFFHQTPDRVWDLYLFAFLFGGGIGAMTGLTTSLGSDMYRGKNFGTILGFTTIGFGVGGAAGAWLGGLVYDLTGSYRVVVAYEFFALILSALFFIAAGRAIRRYKGVSRV